MLAVHRFSCHVGVSRNPDIAHAPLTTGSVEGLIQTLPCEWAYARPRASAHAVTVLLARLLRTQRHSALKQMPR